MRRSDVSVEVVYGGAIVEFLHGASKEVSQPEKN
jgi:hypothetical protein